MAIFGVHPADKDLNFLTSLNSDFAKQFKTFKYLRLEANNHTHEECLSILSKNKDGLLLFFCHALDKSIRGCKIESEFSSNSYKDFQYGALISPTKNLEVFAGKNVFCLACFSREIGKYAMSAGAKVYLGFGDIPFLVTEKFKEERVEAFVKAELKGIVQKALTFAIEQNLTFNELSNLLDLSFSKRQFDLMKIGPGQKLRLEVAKVLSRIKNGITMFGNGNEKLVR